MRAGAVLARVGWNLVTLLCLLLTMGGILMTGMGLGTVVMRMSLGIREGDPLFMDPAGPWWVDVLVLCIGLLVTVGSVALRRMAERRLMTPHSP